MAYKIKPIGRLLLKDMILHTKHYAGLSEGLVQLPLPEKTKISGRYYPVPKDRNEFTGSICYGQRMFFAREENNDFGVIIRAIDGYYYPIVTGKKWDEDKALLFGKNVLTCKVQEVYPVALHLTNLILEMIEREQKLLHREPSKMELAAGIEKLNIFAELSALNFLRDAMKVPVSEVLLTPYNECLVRFMLEKETEDYKARYLELLDKDVKAKSVKK